MLVAGGALLDPNFHQTVVLVTEHSEDGAMGVVLNRPGAVSVAQAVPEVHGLVEDGAPLFVGGPMQNEAVIVLAEFTRHDVDARLILDGIGYLEARALDAEVPVARARAFAGYAGWSPGQLEREVESNSWIIEPALPGDVFSDDPAHLWNTVLRRKGGEHAILSLMPLDPSVN